MARFPRRKAEILALAQELVTGLSDWEYRIVAINKSGEGEPSNTVMAVL